MVDVGGGMWEKPVSDRSARFSFHQVSLTSHIPHPLASGSSVQCTVKVLRRVCSCELHHVSRVCCYDSGRKSCCCKRMPSQHPPPNPQFFLDRFVAVSYLGVGVGKSTRV